MFAIKAARFMSMDSILNALEEMFISTSDPFSVSIHNDRGRFWLSPTDEST